MSSYDVLLTNKTLLFFRCVQHRQFTFDLLKKMDGFMVEVPDISEDCLYLNIYTPSNRAHDAKLPVRSLCCRFGCMNDGIIFRTRLQRDYL